MRFSAAVVGLKYDFLSKGQEQGLANAIGASRTV